ncbi:MAG: ATP-binding protein [Nitrospiraceae bacterium]
MAQTAVMAEQTPIRIAILGAGNGGLRLLELLSHVRGVRIAGVADRFADAPGAVRARDLDIPVTQSVTSLICDDSIHLIIDVTGDPNVEQLVARYKSPATEMLGGTAARLFWQLVQHESQLHNEISHTDKLAALGSFAAGIAHDINNPLYLIMGLAEDLLDHPTPETVTAHAQDIIDAVRRTSRICSDLTRYARRTQQTDPVRVDLQTVLEEALKIGRHALLFQDMTVVRRFDAAHRTVCGNPDELIHLFVNLITNAIHAMDGQGTLTIATRNHGTLLEVDVADTGCGIPPDTLDKIFEPFYTTKAAGKGTGLGLYNVKTILEQLGGSVTITSTVGRGSTFTLTFPVVA